MEKSTVVVGFPPRARVCGEIAAIQDEYASNARLLTYFAQNNPPAAEADSLVMLEAALLRRQEMLVGKMADVVAVSMDDVIAKLELWAAEAGDAWDDVTDDMAARIVFSVLSDIRRLSA